MPKVTKAAEGGKRYPLNMRTTKETRARLERAAMTSGRSLAQEVEHRLEFSFGNEDLIAGIMATAYGSEFAGLIMMIARTMAVTGSHALASKQGYLGMHQWTGDPHSYDMAVEAAQHLLQKARPPGPAQSPNNYDPEMPRKLAEAMVRSVKGPSLFGAYAVDVPRIQQLLGPMADRLTVEEDENDAR